MAIVLFVYLLCLVCWLGGMLFFAMFTAPALFDRLSVADAGKVVSMIFPRYYMLGYVAGILGLLLALYLFAATRTTGWWAAAAGCLAVAVALTFYAGMVVRPRIEAIRTVAEEPNPDPGRKAEFDRLHRLSVQLNGGVMLLDVLAVLSTAAALAPRG